MDYELNLDMILSRLSNSCAPFVLNYYMNGKMHTIREIIMLLKGTEHTFKLEGKSVLFVESAGSKKGYKNKKRKVIEPKGGAPKKKKEPAPKDTCFHYGKDGHWKRNCKVYLEE